MINQQYSITPPPELVRYWARFQGYTPEALWFCIANNAAQWGWDQREPEIQAAVDQELKACCEWLEAYDYDEVGRQLAEVMHAARRPKPKPPTLKEQALLAIDIAVAYGHLSTLVANVVRQALEALPE